MKNFKEFCNEKIDEINIGFINIDEDTIFDMISDDIDKIGYSEYQAGISIIRQSAKIDNNRLNIKFIAYDDNDAELKGHILINVFTKEHEIIADSVNKPKTKND